MLSRHASYVIVEHEFGRQYGIPVRRCAAPVHRYMKTSRIVFVAEHFDVLQETDQFCHTPAQSFGVRFDQNQLQHVDDEESTEFGTVFEYHTARNQIAVVCGCNMEREEDY